MSREDGTDREDRKDLSEGKWWEKLRFAETEADFDLLKDEIDLTMTGRIFLVINSAEVLRACLRYMRLDRDALSGALYNISSKYRVDLLAVFIDHLTWREFTADSVSLYLIRSVLADGHVDVMDFLLQSGLDIEHEVPYSFGHNVCLLTYACYHGQLDIIDLLLSRGANVNKESSRGMTPAFAAMASANVTVLDRLYLHGANLNHRDAEGKNLWTVVSTFERYDKKLPLMRRLAEMRVPLERKVYDRYLVSYRRNRSPELKEVLVLMREVLMYQGEEVAEIPE